MSKLDHSNNGQLKVLLWKLLYLFRPLELVRDRNPSSEMMGHVKLLDSIPYNYRQLNLDLFERMQQTQTSSGHGPGLQVNKPQRRLLLQPSPCWKCLSYFTAAAVESSKTLCYAINTLLHNREIWMLVCKMHNPHEVGSQYHIYSPSTCLNACVALCHKRFLSVNVLYVISSKQGEGLK